MHSSLKCLLCGSPEPRVSRSLTGEQLLAMWQAEGVQFSPTALGDLQNIRVVHLYACRVCGFHFFNPALVGNEQFYSELICQNPAYYAPNRPENTRNAEFAKRAGLRNILDVGCGSGFALDAARAAGLKTYGIELTAMAAAEARSRGHEVFSTLIENLDEHWKGHFDLISLNQLLEHVPDPVSLVKQCIPFLSSKGVIAIAVPASEGILRLNPWLAANWPPHHLSHWRKIDFEHLAQCCGLRLLEMGGNRLLGSVLVENLLIHRRNCQVIGKPYKGFSPQTINVIGYVYRKTGMKYIFNSQGHSIYCFLGRK